MRRVLASVMGALAFGAAALATAPWGVAAGGEDEGQRRERRVERIVLGGARLGVTLEDVDADDVGRLRLGEESGALVKDVVSGSAAEKAGIKDGDVIVSYQGEKVWSAAQLRRLVHETPPGRKVAVEVNRGGSVQRLTAELAARREVSWGDFGDWGDLHVEVPPVPPIPPVPSLPQMFEDKDGGPFRHMFLRRGPRKLGIGYEGLTDQLAAHFKVQGGVLVTQVDDDSPAAHAGVKAGDIVTRAGGVEVRDPDDLRRAVDDAKSGSEMDLTVQRDGRAVELKVKLRASEPLRRRRTTSTL